MKKFKRILSISLALILLMSSVSLFTPAYATDDFGINVSDYTNSELDLSQYTLDDVMNMTPQEYGELVRDFERVYDPYDSYVEEDDELPSIPPGGGSITPLWTSGEIDDDEWVEAGSHEIMTMTACAILSADKGFFSDNALAVLATAMLISLASMLPDKDERGVILFSGHFYNPHTGKNYAGSSTNTARNNAINHYNTAASYANNGDLGSAYEYLGRCLHYIQDINEPHHAANITAINPSHGQFESYAFDNIDSYLGSYRTISSSFYTTAINTSVSTLAHNAALDAYSRKDLVNSIFDKSQWNTQANYCVKAATRYSVMVMYKFSRLSSVPFYT